MSKNLDMISYCGLYCGDCFGHTQKIADMARDLRKEFRNNRFDKLAPVFAEIPFFKEFKDYDKCYNLLGLLVKLRCNKMCRGGGGGSPTCAIRICAKMKKLDGCWQCDEFNTCEKLKVLEGHHGKAVIKNLRKLKKDGPAEFIKGKKYWYTAK
ncbi:MAG: DUF3795 domain-containing protein [Sedimentisphaerales bacterium]|nr:DUF3795 domain-containing protein [Sedimentisphaerales bacterium]